MNHITSNSESRPYAFTGYFPVFRGRIVSDIILCSPHEGNNNVIRIRALWDTGCSKSIVSRRTAEFLRLPVCGEMTFRSSFGGVKPCPLTKARIGVVLGACLVPLEVGIADMPNSDLDCDITLGLDFITLGDFAITHDDEQLALSFCFPPINAVVDFTKWSAELIPGSVNESCDIDESQANERCRRELYILDYAARKRL